MPALLDSFAARFSASFLIGTTGYSVVASILWTAQCSPKVLRPTGLLLGVPGHLLLAFYALLPAGLLIGNSGHLLLVTTHRNTQCLPLFVLLVNLSSGTFCSLGTGHPAVDLLSS